MTTEHVTLAIPGTPPSFNAVGLRSHWATGRRHKLDWQQRCWIMLLKEGVSKGLQLVTVEALLHFKQNRRRDEGNFRVVLEKSLGDALVSGGHIEDDTPDHYRFERLRFTSPSSQAPCTELMLTITR